MSKVLCFSSFSLYVFSLVGISYIPLFILLSSFFTLLFFWKKFTENKDSMPSVFLLSSFVILWISNPLYENDHYRYFFEGKLFLEGINIYQLSPQNFFLGTDQVFPKNLGFPEVPSIYGPLAHLFHGMSFGLMGFSGAIVFIKSLYLSTFLFLWKKYPTKLILLCVPFLTKEFFNSIHLDFFAILLILIGVIQLQKENYNKGLLLTLLSLLIKPTGFIALPLIFSYLHKKMRFQRLFLWLLPFILYAFFVSSWPSILIFAKNWQWNSGIASMTDSFSPTLASWLSLIAPLLLSIFIIIIHIRKRCWAVETLPVELGLIFLVQLLFSQTINSWYLAWPLGFFLLAKCKVPIVWITLAWPLCYAPWLANNSVFYYTLVFHLSGLFVFIYSFHHYLLDVYFSKAFFNLLSPFKGKVFTSD